MPWSASLLRVAVLFSGVSGAPKQHAAKSDCFKWKRARQLPSYNMPYTPAGKVTPATLSSPSTSSSPSLASFVPEAMPALPSLPSASSSPSLATLAPATRPAAEQFTMSFSIFGSGAPQADVRSLSSSASAGPAPIADQGSSPSSCIAPRGHADRPDLPKYKPLVRGSAEVALASAGSDAARKAALENLDEDVFASSSSAPRASLWKTWEKINKAWAGDDEPLPLTVDRIKGIASMFKAGRYRSAANYISRAVEEHVRHGYDWTPALAQTRRGAVRAITRGMGPPRQSAPLPLESFMEFPNEFRPPAGPAYSGWLLNARDMVVLASLWMLREIEVAFARAGDVELSSCGKLVTWRLPVSKTDPQALGKRRTLGCTCGRKPDVSTLR